MTAAVMERRVMSTRKYPVLARLFVSSDNNKVELDRGAALHLYRLLQRYNWCLADDSLRESRWRRFWRGIALVERVLLSHFVKAHCGGRLGVRVRVEKPPVDFEQFEDDPSPVQITPAVEHEFRRVLDDFYKRLLPTTAVKEVWRRRCPEQLAVLEASGLTDTILSPATPWVADDMQQQIAGVLAAMNESSGDSQEVATALVSALLPEVEERERALC